MYIPSHFAEQDDEIVAELVRASGFGHLVIGGVGGLSSTPMPFVVDDAMTSIRAHLARPNPVWRAAPCDSLLIVPVSDAYISPGWYPSKAEHGEVVPTWNYEVVHLHGRLVVHDDDRWVYQQVAELTDTNESVLANPWAVTDAPDTYIARMCRGIVGIELVVDRVVCKRKLSQNRSAVDVAGVLRGLDEHVDRRAHGVAEAMRR